MKQVHLIDVQDRGLPPAVYLLAFAGLLTQDLQGNDRIYEVDCWDEVDLEHLDTYPSIQSEWKEKLNRKYHWDNINEYIKTKPKVSDAWKVFLEYLKDNKIKASDDLLIKIWW